MSKTIIHRIYDFLKDYPPFSFIDKEILLKIASQVKVIYSEKDELIFKQGVIPEKHFYVVREGAVELYNEYETQKLLVDICDEGDIFGIRPLFHDNQPYTLTAKVSEESLVYKIPSEPLREIIQNNFRVKEFFQNSFVAGVRSPYSMQIRNKSFTSFGNELVLSEQFTELQTIELRKKPITCSPNTKIKDAAKIMRDNNIGSLIVVDNSKFPVGILTDRDLRNKVVPGDIDISDVVTKIMSSPVITQEMDVTIADLQIKMIENNIHHICITEEGTNKSKTIGIVSEHDILLTNANNPSVLIREIKRAKNEKELQVIRENADELMKNYLMHGVSISFISRIITEINNHLTRRAIEFAITELQEKSLIQPNLNWCWLALGSQGREEQLLKTDQDNAIIFEDVERSEYKKIKIYFLELAKIVTRILNTCGFDYCPSNMMANNPRWCLSLTEWKEQFRNWIYSPGEKEVMYSTIFFDYRPIYGNKKLTDELTAAIDEYIDKQKSFLSFLAKNALENPAPIGFFRNLLVEHNGKHKNEFDIKARAMMPLVDAARVLVLEKKVRGINNTPKRCRKLAEIEPQNKDLFLEAADAFEILMHFRALEGIKNNNIGRYFNPKELNKMQRVMLRNSFKPIKEIQNILTIRFKTDLFR